MYKPINHIRGFFFFFSLPFCTISKKWKTFLTTCILWKKQQWFIYLRWGGVAVPENIKITPGLVVGGILCTVGFALILTLASSDLDFKDVHDCPLKERGACVACSQGCLEPG